jgi:hypothetical protein
MADKYFCAKLSQRRNIVCVSQVASGDPMAHADQNTCDSAHARAANADEMNYAQVIGHRLIKVWFYHDVLSKVRRRLSLFG